MFSRPKEAAKLFRKKLQLKNGKVIWLQLELLEMATFLCELPLHTQIASKEFMMQINTLLNLKDLPQDVATTIYKYISYFSKMVLKIFFP